MDVQTLRILIEQKDAHEIREFYIILQKKHQESSPKEEAGQEALETLAFYTKDYQLENVDHFHKHINDRAQSNFRIRQKMNARGSAESDWYRAVYSLASEALRNYSPKKYLFALSTTLSLDEPISEESPQPKIGDHL